jgi:hypothetical protein
MTMQAVQETKHRISRRSQGIQDLLLVSSFGLWAVVLGLSPVLAVRWLTGS